MIDYKKRLVEVDEVLSYMSENDLMKIPESIRSAISQAKDPKYFWKYDQTKSLSEQGLSRDTITILSYLNTEYMLDEEQKQLMQQIHEFNEKKYRDSLEKTRINDTSINFSNTVSNEIVKVDVTEETTALAVKTQELSFFDKFINKMKNIFSKK